MIIYMYNPTMLRSEVNKYILMMFIGAFLSFSFIFVAKWMFGVVGENITLNVRKQLYTAILLKHVGWHDNQDNAAGILSATLASDVQQLNGVSTEGLAVMAEAMFSLLGGIVLSFIFSWKVALVSLAIVPFMIIGSAINAKFTKAQTEENPNKEKQSSQDIIS